MSTKRKDNKGRILRDNEIQKSDGRYEYRYYDVNQIRKSIYSWRLTESDPTPAGKRACRSLREMEKTILNDIQDDLLVSQKITLNNKWDDYINHKHELKQSTRANYRYMYNRFIRESIGGMRISSIKYSTMKNLFSKLLFDDELKINTLTIIYSMLNPVFDIAVRDQYIRLNPIRGVVTELKHATKYEKPKRHPLSEEHQKIFLNYVKNSKKYDKWYNLFCCLLGTGCRIGEMLGLTWNDIDWDKNTISINRNLLYIVREDETVKFTITTPKTKSGIREIPMFSSVKNALINEYNRRKITGFCEQTINGCSGFIWTNHLNTVLRSHDVNDAIHAVVKSYNETKEGQASPIPDFSVHQMRHTFCTRLCENERDLKLIQEIMGHSDISITMDVYNESNMKRKQASFEKLDSLNGIF